MNNHDDTPDAGTLEALAQLPLPVSFDLGGVTMTLAEVAGLQIGQVVDLGLPLSEAVHIRINGACVGLGELVDVDGRLAVQVRTLAAPDLGALAPRPDLSHAPAEPALQATAATSAPSSASSPSPEKAPRNDPHLAETGLPPDSDLQPDLQPYDGAVDAEAEDPSWARKGLPQ